MLFCFRIFFSDDVEKHLRINRTHLRALRVVHMKYDDTFENLLSINNSNTIHVQNLQQLMTEVYP